MSEKARRGSITSAAENKSPMGLKTGAEMSRYSTLVMDLSDSYAR